MGALEASNGMREPPRSGENYIDTGPFVWYLYALFQAGKVFSWALMWPVFHGVETINYFLVAGPADFLRKFMPFGLLTMMWPDSQYLATAPDLSRHYMGIPGPESLGPCVFLGWLQPRDQIGESRRPHPLFQNISNFRLVHNMISIWYAYLSATFLHQEKDCLWVGIGNAARMKRCVSRTEGSRSHSWKHI